MEYRSHPNKWLRIHMNGVLNGVRRRTSSKTAITAALFHDLGKLNPNFQPKLDGQTVTGYSSHAYLSAHAFLCYCKTNQRQLAQDLGIVNEADVFSVLAQIARHHGNFPDFIQIFNPAERERLLAFLATNPKLPISDFLSQWLPHQSFDVLDARLLKVTEKHFRLSDKALEAITNKLDFFLDSQHSFACLLEADKRDAGNNAWFQREEHLDWARKRFTPLLNSAISKLSPHTELDLLRTAIREEATRKVSQALPQGVRTFSLTAPTGAGKTFALLALADEIRQWANAQTKADYAVVYALPFLTITEQVEEICRAIFNEYVDFVTRLDSRSQDPQLEMLLTSIEEQPKNNAELLQRSFSRDTWDAGFIITTFVQLFETLLSNQNATLLRLPNFDKCVFLLDEIQALPPRLYVFLTAYLQAFCEKYDCYAILSTATMPDFRLPDTRMDSATNARSLFSSYTIPTQLLNFVPYYGAGPFDRYIVSRLDQDRSGFSLGELASHIRKNSTSCLIVLNTIEDSRRLYEMLCPSKQCQDVLLLNTHFTLEDRRAKIAICKQRLKDKQPIVLVSTQLIEAGVDIDFPVVYRDMCPLPSLIQAAGRCNRNKEIATGRVYFFELYGDNGKSRAELIYRDHADQWILDFSREYIIDEIPERNLLQVQTAYFERINTNLAVGDHRLLVAKERKLDNLIKRINEAAFEIVGSFRLIDEQAFGEEYRYYVAENDQDTAWQDLKDRRREFAQALAKAEQAGVKLSYADSKRYQISMEDQLRRMNARVVQVRVRSNTEPLPIVKKSDGEPEILCGLRNLLAPERDYSFYTGIDLSRTVIALL